jgi:protein O-mannosyl-transferase
MKIRNPPLPSHLPAPAPKLSLQIALITAVILAATVFAVYSPALNFQFILDDHHFVNDPRLQESGHLFEYFTSYVWAQVTGGPLSFYRPVFALWLRLSFILAGASSWGWHLLSIAKHVMVTALLGLLAWKLLHDRIAALIAAALFALHPAQTESVAWVTVPDPLMSAAVLGTVLLYLSYGERVSTNARSPKSHKKPRKPRGKSSETHATLWLVGSAAACLAALMAKETAIVLFPILFAVAFLTPFETQASPAKLQSAGSRLTSAFLSTLPFLGVTVFYLLLRLIALGGRISPPTQYLPWRTVLLSAPATLWFYIKVMLWPVHSRAFADSDLSDTFSMNTVLLPALGVLAAAAVLALACLWAWRKAERDLPGHEATGIKRALLLGALILVLPILLALNLNALNPGDFLHGRYTYLPLTGLMLLLVTGWRLMHKGRLAALAAAALLAIAFGVLTVTQEAQWKDDLAVFTVAHQYAPRNAPVAQNLARTHVQVALALDDQGRCDEAVPMFQQAIQQYPQDWFAWAGLGECLFKLNDLPGAEQSLRRASELSRQPRVIEQWQQLRSRMGLPPASLP